MPYRKYIPAADADCLAWCRTFASVLVADPARFGVTPTDVAALPPLVGGFESAVLAATDPGVRTRTVVLAKRQARAALEAEVRRLVRLIRAKLGQFPDASKRLLELGLPHPAPAGRSGRVDPPPSERPSLIARRQGLTTIDLTVTPYTFPDRPGLGGSIPESKALPQGVAGIMLFYTLVPPTPPTSPTSPTAPPAPDGAIAGIPDHHDDAALTRWRFLTLTTRRRLRLTLPPPATPEERTHTPVLIARFYNRKGQPGPVSFPVVAQLAA